ncbi:Cytochrome oxidase assembly [Apiotrichum porosum]|uniref:Cytochrome c oxidase assembly protein COX16, mitochondrial n=1 Tax=Apiotrichum porosum TaxID=105984 RepID=A0A427Y930_9TREE|nr:Cytochrome oxidase assembly [Apiotrichum porosum]RSH87640.1 Cytochrome oxidase assembly [Apiotrichum porosum]
MSFSSRSRNPNPLLNTVRKHPFVLFGLPFLSIVVVSSFALKSFTQNRYDLDNQKVQAVNKEESLGMAKDRKKIDIREEYYRLTSGALAEESLSALDSTPSMSTTAPASSSGPRPPRKKKFSMAATTQDDYEPVRVPRPDGVSEWGAMSSGSEDAPVKGSRPEDRWV